eukprot:12090659-Alexandrium_andersonii.AAC.1
MLTGGISSAAVACIACPATRHWRGRRLRAGRSTRHRRARQLLISLWDSMCLAGHHHPPSA